MLKSPSIPPGKVVLAIDPGRDKCGIAVVRSTAAAPGFEILHHEIVPSQAMQSSLPSLLTRFGVEQLIIGDATTSQRVRDQLVVWAPEIPIIVVEERNSTLEARALYWREHPPRGWRRLVPLSLQVPPEPVDDFAAVILVQRYFMMDLN